MRLENKVAIITGTADPGGIGAAIAGRFAREGAKIVVADIMDGNNVVDNINQSGGDAVYVKTDVADQEDCLALADAGIKKYRKIDILVNNAAIYGDIVARFFTDLTTEDWVRMLKVNAIGPFHCTKAVFPFMKANGGKIINTTSSSIFEGGANAPHYVASKGAVMAFTRSMARLLGQFNINVNSLAPGFTQTGASKRLQENAAIPIPDIDALMLQMRSLKRSSTPEDMTGTAVFLASDDSDFITGQLILCDGGLSFH